MQYVHFWIRLFTYYITRIIYLLNAVNLTKTKTDRKEQKSTLVETVREAVDQYKYAYVFGYENLRTGK